MISVWTWDCKNWLLYILQGRLWCPQMIKKCFCWSLTRDVQLQQINLDDTIQIQQKTILFHIKIIKEPRNHWWLQLPADQQPIATPWNPHGFSPLIFPPSRRLGDRVRSQETARRQILLGSQNMQTELLLTKEVSLNSTSICQFDVFLSPAWQSTCCAWGIVHTLIWSSF